MPYDNIPFFTAVFQLCTQTIPVPAGFCFHLANAYEMVETGEVGIVSLYTKNVPYTKPREPKHAWSMRDFPCKSSAHFCGGPLSGPFICLIHTHLGTHVDPAPEPNIQLGYPWRFYSSIKMIHHFSAETVSSSQTCLQFPTVFIPLENQSPKHASMTLCNTRRNRW